MFGTNTFHLKEAIDVHAGEKGRVTFSFAAKLGPGLYSITVATHQNDTHLQNNFHWIDLAVTFSVVNTTYPLFTGVSYLGCTASIVLGEQS